MEATFAVEKVFQLEEYTQQGINDGYLPELPTGKLKAGKVLMDDALRKVVIDRLVHLQYLDKRSGVSIIALNQAISQLQQEANLHVDGWLGYKTWQAIQQVFTFEESTQLEQWLDDDIPCEFIIRAIYLRLRSLGIIEEKRIYFSSYSYSEAVLKRRETVDIGLIKFRDILITLGIAPIHFPLDEKFRIPLMDRLFDQDSLIQQVHDQRKSLRVLLSGVALYAKADTTLMQATVSHALRFLGHLAKVELWLHGYYKGIDSDPDNVVIAPDGNNLVFHPILNKSRTKVRKGFSRPVGISSVRKVKLNGLLHIARKFCKESQVDKRKMACLTLSNNDLKLGIFNGQVTNAHVIIDILTCAYNQSDAYVNSESRAIKIVNTLHKKQNKISEENWKEVSFGNYLLDGVKRLWRIFKAAVKGLIKKLSESIYRVICLAKHLAFNGMVIFKRAVIAMSQGFSLLFNKIVPGSNHLITMQRQSDMDFMVLLDSNASSADLKTFINSLEKKVQGFKFSIIVFNLIIDAINIVKKTLINPIYGGLALMSYLLTIDGVIDEKDMLVMKNTLLS